MNLGDTIKFLIPPYIIKNIVSVDPVKFDTINEQWVVCAQNHATHMMMHIEVTELDSTLYEMKTVLIEIGKCENIYLLADAIVD
jgi:hypothetical protein